MLQSLKNIKILKDRNFYKLRYIQLWGAYNYNDWNLNLYKYEKGQKNTQNVDKKLAKFW